MNEAIVDLRDVYCVHRTPEGDAAALQGLNLELYEGELVCALGPSGAGKSTLLRVIAGVEVPSAGSVRVLGQDIGRLPARLRARFRHERIGFLGQHAEAALAPDLPVEQAVALPLWLRGSSRRARQQRVEELLDAAALRDRSRALPGELSGGERQRVALCAALVHRPALLLADEPTGELDDDSAAAMRALLAELASAERATLLLVSHDPGTAAIAQRTVAIRDGRIVEDTVGGRSALVVGRGGWLQLPAELLAQVGIGDRARVQVVDGGLLIRGARPAPELITDRAATRKPGADASWSPSRIEVRAVSRGYGRGSARREVFEQLSLSFSPGRLTVVCGRSGVGKTTLLRLLAGLDRPEGGEVLVDEASVGDLDAERAAALRRRQIGYLPQEPSPVGFLSAEENVVLALRLRGWEPDTAGERATEVLARVGLIERARQRVSRLSAGEGQRVALARALAGARGLLIVDEPTSRLDRAGAASVAELLASAAAGDRQTVIAATHDPELIRRADEVVAL